MLASPASPRSLRGSSLTVGGRWGAPRGFKGAGPDLAREVERRGLVVDVLVNNAGFATYAPFELASPDREREEVQLNVAAVVDLTHAFFPGMLARGRGAVVNVASTAAF